ncbi:MAG TPA: antitoxin Xre-like helix-turn-helix domain-containing protein, partial [Ferruginibacter sp.]|nr:antitoxin Xre-like helix-turn-helix domain-containing protein [Ferruginibacter sp.]
MKKNEPEKKQRLYTPKRRTGEVNEPAPVYRSIKSLPQVKDFTYNEFKKVADKTPFTQTEWAAMLHVSERTLQRYAKSNGVFAPIIAERFHQLHTLFNKGKQLFGTIRSFYDWIHSNPPMLEGELSFSSLTSFDGIQKVMTQIGRIEHGIL